MWHDVVGMFCQSSVNGLEEAKKKRWWKYLEQTHPHWAQPLSLQGKNERCSTDNLCFLPFQVLLSCLHSHSFSYSSCSLSISLSSSSSSSVLQNFPPSCLGVPPSFSSSHHPTLSFFRNKIFISWKALVRNRLTPSPLCARQQELLYSSVCVCMGVWWVCVLSAPLIN